ncbi:MAG: hypothetical protein F9K16_00220 [Thermoanaerobaculia bacterium]|nr:MAG: hypothetical protein F9K16_00220 [Thermoanaerobaculia bacterium]
MAVDESGTWAAGYYWGAADDEEASVHALEECAKSRLQYVVTADCRIVALGNQLVKDGSLARGQSSDRRIKPAVRATEDLRLESDAELQANAVPYRPERRAAAISYEARWIEGTSFVIGTAEDGDLQLRVSFTAGRDTQAFVYLANGTGRSITFDPSTIAATCFKRERERIAAVPLRVFGPEEYEKKIRTKQAWSEALNGIAAGMAAYADTQPTTTSYREATTHSGDFSARSRSPLGTSVTGSYSGTTSRSGVITNWPSPAERNAAFDRRFAQARAIEEQHKASYQAMASSLARRHTLNPGTFYGGIVHLSRARGDKVQLRVPFGGEMFVVEFTMPGR